MVGVGVGVAVVVGVGVGVAVAVAVGVGVAVAVAVGVVVVVKLPLTASKLQLWSKCGWAFENPVPESTTSIYAERGTRIDDAVQSGEVLSDLEERNIVDMVREKLNGLTVLHQQSFALWPQHGNVERIADRSGYPLGSIGGTSDYIINGNTIADLKTGRQAGLGPAGESFQLRHNAYCAWKRGLVTLPCRIEYWHATADGINTSNSAVFTEFDAEVFLEEVRRPSPPLNSGPHCRTMFCPAYGTVCPTTAVIAKEVNLPVVHEAALIHSPEHAGEIYRKLKAIDSMRDKAWQALKDYATQQGEFPTENGKYGPKVIHREKITVTEETKRILEYHGVDSALEVNVTVSKEAIKAATRRVAGSGKPRTELERKVFSDLREIGAAKTYDIQSVGEIDDK